MSSDTGQEILGAPSSAEQRDVLRSARFRLEREAHWQRLDLLVARVENAGASALNYHETRDMVAASRQAMTSLSVARDISLDRALVDYLESLCSRAYLVIYAPQEGVGGLVARLLAHGIPQAVRRSVLPLLAAFAALILGIAVGYHLFSVDQNWYYTFVPGEMADMRTPGASASYLRTTLYDGDPLAGDTLAAFATYLFSHNTQIAILIFALGIFWALPSFVLTFYNGLLLGAFYAMFADKGLGYDVIAWLSIHGVTELSAIVIACAGGARLGFAVLMPGALTRREALRQQGKDAVKLVILAGLMLITAAFIEGVLRQRIFNPEIRLALGWGMGLFWLLWLTLSGRKPRETQGEPAL